MAHKRKILTFLLLSAGCGTTAAPARQTAGAAEVPVPTVAGTATTTTAAAVPPAAEPATAPRYQPPLRDEAQPAARIELRTAFYRAGRDAALASSARFRPLCDADGYPLVGNLATKGRRYTVSDFCAETAATPPPVRGNS